jgi:hypothetical protein
MTDRNDETVRQGALLLSALVLTPDSALAAFRDRRTADPELDVELLTQARAILDALGICLRTRRAENWQRVKRAWEILRHVAPGEERVVPATTDAASRGCATMISARPASAATRAALSAPIDSTAFMAPIDAVVPAALPFDGSHEAPPNVGPLQPHAAVGETASFDVDDLGVDETSPFRHAVAVHAQDVARYAAIVASTEDVSPARRAELHLHYGVRDERARRALDQQMGSAFRHEPALRARFASELERWRQYLQCAVR